MFKQILPTKTMRNIQRTMRRTCVLILGLKGLIIQLFDISLIMFCWLKPFTPRLSHGEMICH